MYLYILYHVRERILYVSYISRTARWIFASTHKVKPTYNNLQCDNNTSGWVLRGHTKDGNFVK